VKRFLWVVYASLTALAMIGCLAAALFIATHRPQPQHAVCLQSHREVVLIPTICGEHDVCQKPIVTDVCERIESPPPRPLRQGDQDD
jgi:hypothetical protein